MQVSFLYFSVRLSTISFDASSNSAEYPSLFVDFFVNALFRNAIPHTEPAENRKSKLKTAFLAVISFFLRTS